MRILLTSGGICTSEIIQAVEQLVGKKRSVVSVAIINEAYAVEDGDKRWSIDEMNSVAQTFNGEIDLVNLRALSIDEITSRISCKDIVYVVGGHTDYLMNVFNNSGFSKILPKLLKHVVYIGSSAGSMVMGQRVSTAANQLVYDEGDSYGVTDYLGIVDFAMKPHLDSPLFPNNRRDTLETISRDYDKPIYGLKDTQAVVIDNGNIRYIGGQPLRLVSGKEIA